MLGMRREFKEIRESKIERNNGSEEKREKS